MSVRPRHDDYRLVRYPEASLVQPPKLKIRLGLRHSPLDTLRFEEPPWTAGPQQGVREVRPNELHGREFEFVRGTLPGWLQPQRLQSVEPLGTPRQMVEGTSRSGHDACRLINSAPSMLRALDARVKVRLEETDISKRHELPN